MMTIDSLLRSAATRLALLLAPVALSSLSSAQTPPAPARPALAHYNVDGGLALSGYDPTTYFAEGGGKPAQGKKGIEATHRGVTYRFANETNRERFLKAPARFEPAFGGWCAYAMAKGKQVEVDPESFLVEDGRLLLFYKGFLNDTRAKWQKEGPAKLRPGADTSWKKISGEGSDRDVSQFNLNRGLALNGYDPVAYRAGSAAQGKQALATTFRGIEYRFASEASKSSFLKAPSAFEPHYGGWCAWAMAQGKKVKVDPEAFVRDEAGLFLFYNRAKRDEWLAARESMIRDADRHWTEVTTD